MRYDTVVFDLDGTLLNTIRDLADAANYVCRAHGWPEHTLDEYRYFVGNGIPKLCQRFAPETARDEASQKEVLAQFSARYAAHKEDTTAPYPGIEAMLEALSAAGVRYGVLTNKEHTLAQGVMEHYFPGRFEFVQGAVPGVPTRMAVMQPPYTAPQYMPSRAENASTVGMLNVSGMIRATPMAAVSPGNAPKIIPSPVPTVHASKAAGAAAC